MNSLFFKLTKKSQGNINQTSIFRHLPNEVIHHILSYSDVIKYRNGVYMNQIPKTDLRYSMIRKIPSPDVHVLLDLSTRFLGRVNLTRLHSIYDLIKITFFKYIVYSLSYRDDSSSEYIIYTLYAYRYNIFKLDFEMKSLTIYSRE